MQLTEYTPHISVIVTTYNRKEFLRKCVTSILSQSFTDFELIIVDQFSDYDFFSLIREFDDNRIKGYQNASPGGVISRNRNFGIAKSVGKYLAFCDDDDMWCSDKLLKQVKVAQSFKDIEKLLIYSNATCFGKGIASYDTQKKIIKTINDLIFENHITLSTVFVTRSDLIFFDETPELRASEDYFLWINLLQNGYEPVMISDCLVKYYVSPNSSSRFDKSAPHLRFILVLVLFKLRYPSFRANFCIFRSIGQQLVKFYLKKLIY